MGLAGQPRRAGGLAGEASWHRLAAGALSECFAVSALTPLAVADTDAVLAGSPSPAPSKSALLDPLQHPAQLLPQLAIRSCERLYTPCQ